MTANGDDSVVRITMKDVYAEVQAGSKQTADLARAVENLTGEMRGSMALMVARTDTTSEEVKDHEARLRMVEARKTISPREVWVALGVVIAALGVIASIIGLVVQGVVA